LNLSKVNDSVILSEYVKRFTLPPGTEYIKQSKTAADHCRAYLSGAARREMFLVCFLNSQNQVITTEVLFEGTLNTSAVYPREVVERVIALGCGSLILCHNHPSGCTTPSSSDRAVTRKLQKAMEAIDVQILDHIILGGSEFFSFADHRLI